MITPRCKRCKRKLVTYSALLFGPPDDEETCDKAHLCAGCYIDVLDLILAGEPT